MTIFVVKPKMPEYPNAKFPGVVVWSEIYNVTGPVLRFANSIASQGYIVACPVVFHEFTGPAALAYDVPGTDAGNAYKVKKVLSAYDEDAKKAVDLLMEHKNCNGRIGTTGMCLGGHLAFRIGLYLNQRRICRPRHASYSESDIHNGALSSTGDDSLVRASKGDLKGEVVLIFGTQDGHVPLAGRNLIRQQLNSAGLKMTFLELQANHAFIRDELSKGRFDAAISKVCFELLLETFGRTIGRDLGERVVQSKGDEKLVC
ncbi:BQ5605_C002g01410 [Microbotryum silenes-dioicae]|uniref:BQ5605_C002g01410 protein n=1 Tax=Microbotryum silenes-dioicae TaxID=796604 RepID=A0A2X0M354_9BASI|nr:BQ5605_C002g01410 [Microbotryum silenes-dioicae]